MTENEWMLLVGGVAGGFVLNVVANLVHPVLLKLLGKSSDRQLRKKQEAEWGHYKFVKKLRDRGGDKHFLYLLLSAIGVMCFVLLCTGVVVGMLMTSSSSVPTILGAAGAGGVLGSFVILIQTEMRIQNFPRYEEQVRKKWGLPPEK